MPPQLRTLAAKVTDFAASLANSAALRQRFAKDPSGTLEAYGIGGIVAEDSEAIRALQIALDTSLIEVAKRGGYAHLFNEMRKKGYVKSVRRSELKKHFVEVLKDNRKSFMAFLDSATQAAISKQGFPVSGGPRLTNLVELLQPGGVRSGRADSLSFDDEECGDICFGVAAAVSFVWIAVVAWTYVVVGATFAVGITAVSWISVACQMGVAGCGSGQTGSLGTSSTSGAIVSAAMQNIANMNTAATVARLAGKPGIARQAIINGISQEVEAVISAAEQLRFIEIPPSRRNAVLSELKLIVAESIGVN